MTSPSIGEPAPDFELPATSEKNIKLSDLRGRKVVVYFYPRDNTSGCTLEANDFKSVHKEFEKLNCCIIGISRDSLKTHENFKAKHQFPFELASDKEETVCKLFDVIKEKTMYGKKHMGIERSTFLIDENGRLLHEWRKVKVPGHVAAVLETVKNS